MNYLMIVLRLIHIVSGVFWIGGSLMMTQFVGPAVGSDPQAGQKMLQYLMSKARVSTWLSAAAGATVLAGAIMYLLDSDFFTSAWTTSGPGIGFAIGAIFGLIGFGVGIRLGRMNKELAALGAQIQGQPTPDQAAQLAAIRKSLGTLTPVNTYAMLLAVLFMATARYFLF